MAPHNILSSNLTKMEKQALNNLSKKYDLIIKPVDKGGGGGLWYRIKRTILRKTHNYYPARVFVILCHDPILARKHMHWSIGHSVMKSRKQKLLF